MLKDIFDRIGIYDFFCICGSGIILILYYISTMLMVEKGNISDLIVFLEKDSFSLITASLIFAYFIGLIVHEIGRIIMDIFVKKFPDKTIEELKTDKVCKINIIKKDFVKDIKDAEPTLTFNSAWKKLRKKDYPTRIDKYHSIYGLTRGLLVGIVAHLLFSLIYYGIVYGQFGNKTFIIILVFDCILSIIFFIRTYRYYLLWVKTVFAQQIKP